MPSNLSKILVISIPFVNCLKQEFCGSWVIFPSQHNCSEFKELNCTRITTPYLLLKQQNCNISQ